MKVNKLWIEEQKKITIKELTDWKKKLEIAQRLLNQAQVAIWVCQGKLISWDEALAEMAREEEKETKAKTKKEK